MFRYIPSVAISHGAVQEERPPFTYVPFFSEPDKQNNVTVKEMSVSASQKGKTGFVSDIKKIGFYLDNCNDIGGHEQSKTISYKFGTSLIVILI